MGHIPWTKADIGRPSLGLCYGVPKEWRRLPINLIHYETDWRKNVFILESHGIHLKSHDGDYGA